VSKLLDVGCGDGEITSCLANSVNAEAWGVDISREKLGVAKAKGIQAQEVNLEDGVLPFPSEQFDCVLCLEVIEHLINTDDLLMEIHRVLVPSGILILSTPNLVWWLNRIVLLFGYHPYSSDVSALHNVGKFGAKYIKPFEMVKVDTRACGHYRLFSYKALKDLLEVNHFNIETCCSLTILPRAIPRPLGWLDKLLSRRASLSLSLAVVASKVK
jgi:2-polyprenyl-3-methyl-5-hydroxy-6-metoxy-1,4-benzoquinol methylase